MGLRLRSGLVFGMGLRPGKGLKEKGSIGEITELTDITCPPKAGRPN